jgi:hypothetical protein
MTPSHKFPLTIIHKVSSYDTLQTSKSRLCHSWLPTWVAQVRCQVTYCGICGEQSVTEGTEEGYPLPILIPPTNSRSLIILSGLDTTASLHKELQKEKEKEKET